MSEKFDDAALTALKIAFSYMPKADRKVHLECVLVLLVSEIRGMGAVYFRNLLKRIAHVVFATLAKLLSS